jgi:hypothetical protein
VAAYHEARLGELVARVADAVDRHRAGELDAFEVDQVIHVRLAGLALDEGVGVQ